MPYNESLVCRRAGVNASGMRRNAARCDKLQGQATPRPRTRSDND
jgi:hypothetical protein